jgi:hypothetical protein
MEQRPLRLGDTLDDYCPRERRVTNHAIVAIVEDSVKQTRCTTCDAEHPYKGGQAPRRKKKGTAALVDTNLPLAPVMVETPDDNLQASENVAGAASVLVEAAAPAAAAQHEDEQDTDAQDVAAQPAAAPMGRIVDPIVDPIADDPIVDDSDEDERIPDIEEGPVHRPLIRAQLPRVEGQKDERRPTDFTIRQNGGRGGNVSAPSFRGSNNGRMKPRGGGGLHGTNGHRPSGGPRFAGARPGQGQGQGRGQGGGFRSAQQQPRQGGGRKRSR